MTKATPAKGRFESIDALMARYVAGALPEPARVLVASHLAIRPDNRPFTAGLEALAGMALERQDGIPIGRRNERVAAIMSAPFPVAAVSETGGSIFPKPLRDFVGFDVDDVPWRTKMPGFREFDLGEVDGCHASLFWLRPGRRIPAHTHEGSELTLVLDGAFSDSIGRYGRGDISIADDAIDHRPIAEADRACIGFAITDGDLRLTGSLGQRLGDILGL